jgi:hypothetical protein
MSSYPHTTPIIRGAEFELKSPAILDVVTVSRALAILSRPTLVELLSPPPLCQCCGENPSVQRVVNADMDAMCGLDLPVRRDTGAMKFIWFTGEICADCLHDYYVPEEKFVSPEREKRGYDAYREHNVLWQEGNVR